MSEDKPSDGVDVKPLLDVLARRGGAKSNDPGIGVFENVRQLSLWTGTVHDIQLLTLKRNAMLITGSKVVLGVDPENRTVNYVYRTPVESIVPLTEPQRSRETIHSMMEALVLQVLGPGWTITHGGLPEHDTIPSNVTRATSKSRKPSKRKRKGSSKKARNRK